MKFPKACALFIGLSLLSFGCTAEDGKDPGPWSCKSESQCRKQIRITNKMPSKGNDAELLHLVKNAKFMVIEVRSPIFVLRLREGEWLNSFLDLTLLWMPDEELIPDTECKEGQPLRAKTLAELPEYAHFYGRMPNFHSEGVPPRGKTHHLLLYPIRGSSQKPRFCVWIADDSGGQHNGAVHGEND